MLCYKPLLKRSEQFCPDNRLKVLGSPSKTGLTIRAGIEHDESSLEGNVTVDIDAQAGARLQAAKAGAVTGVAEVHQVAWNRDACAVVVDSEREVGRARIARERVTSSEPVELAAADVGVVVVHDLVGEKQQRSARIGDALDAGLLEAVTTNLVARRGEAPEAETVVYRGVGNRARVARVVDEAEVVGTGCVVAARVSMVPA